MSYYSRRNLPWPISLAIGLCALGFSFYSAAKTARIVWSGHHVQAQVVAVNSRYESTGRHSHGTRYHPVLSFTDSLNHKIQFEDSSSSRENGYYFTGQMHPVLYLESTPVYAVVDTGWRLWSTAFISALMGAIFTGAALAKLRASGGAQMS